MKKEELKAKYGKEKIPFEWRKTDKFSAVFTTFFGSGMLPKMPGTYGSLAAAITVYPLAYFAHTSSFSFNILNQFNTFFLVLTLLIFFVSIPIVNKAMRDTHTEDPGWIVIDEVCGIFAAASFVKIETLLNAPWIILFIFGIFRFFDILKPLGIHRFEKLPNAWGVMADDLLGGIYSGITILLGGVILNQFFGG